MQIIVNDLSFKQKMPSKEDVLEKLLVFIRICHQLESGKMRNVEGRILADKIDVQFELAPGWKMIQLLQSVLPVEERRYFLSILMNRAPADPLPSEPFWCEGKFSYACAMAKEGATVSLLSAEVFSKSLIWGRIGEEEAILRNIGREEHIHEHRHLLGLRIYRANDVKHKKLRRNFYGKGRSASPMDLDQDQAQRLLDRAIEYKGRLYGRFRDKNYSFQNEQDVYYHGYLDEELGDDIKRELDRHRWE
mgnify:CR=1 FL=1